MTKWRAILTITKEFDNRTDAIISLDYLVGKVPAGWEIRTESVSRE